MRNFKTKWMASLLSVLLVFSMVVGGMQISAYAEQNEESAQTTEESAADTAGRFTEEQGIAAALVDAEDAEESAVITEPSQLALDGSKSYVIFTPCFWGGHTYAIGPDAAATEGLGISSSNCTAGKTIYLANKGLGWTLTQTENGLKIQLGGGQYLTVSDDGQRLVISETEKISGLTLNDNGTLSLADAGTKTVYLQKSDLEPEPERGQQFKISDEGSAARFYFAEIQKPKDDPEKPEKPDDPKPSEEVLFPSLLPQTNFRAEVVSPDKVYGDDQYVIFTEKGEQYVAITGSANCSSPLSLDKAAAAGVRLSSPDQNVLWTVNNNRNQAAAENGYYKYICSCASNQYLTAGDSLLSESIQCDFYLAEKDESSALIATAGGKYLTLAGDGFALTKEKASASRFYFAKLLQKNEQQAADGTTAIPEGTLLRLADWNSIEDGKTYAIINANEFNRLHYALSGNGRLARYGADNLTKYNLCPKEEVSGVYGAAPCESSVGDIFYTNGQDILWTASGSNNHKATFKNNSTGLYLKLSEGPAAEQTPSISADPATITIEPASDKAYAYLGDDAGHYLGIWQYIAASVSETAPERCAWYLAEVLSSDEIKNLPATAVHQDSDKKTVSFGGLYSIYQGSQHLIGDGTDNVAGVETYIMMDDGKESFKPNDSKYGADNENNYYITYCADYDSDMPVFTNPGKYEAISLNDYDKFDAGQKSALKTIISNSYPYVSVKDFLYEMKAAGFEVSESCGTDEIMAGIQAAIYTFTNPLEGGKNWGYDSSDGWAHNSYEINKPESYVSDSEKAKNDVNTVRDYLCNLAAPVATAADEGEEAAPQVFAITTEIDGETYAVGSSNGYSYEVVPYNPEDITQLWYEDEKGFIHWYPSIFDEDGYLQRYFVSAYFNMNKFKDNDVDEYEYEYEYKPYLGSYYSASKYTYDSSYTEYKSRSISGYMPLTIEKTDDGKSYLKMYDPDNKMTEDKLSFIKDNFPENFSEGELNYPEFEIIDDNGSLQLTINDIKAAPGENTRQFNRVDVTPVLPEAIIYDLEELKWSIDYNDDKTAYGVTINGKLNRPIRKAYDRVRVNLYCNDVLLGNLEFEDDQQTFTVSSEKVIPDSEEAHFWIRIDEKCLDVTIFEPTEGTGWQLQIGSVFSDAIKEIHEDTSSIPVEKVWGDEKDHSRDIVKLALLENGKETGYTTTVDEASGWKGAFKHVPNRRWTYGQYGWDADDPPQFEIPIWTHEYTMEELDVKSGYTPVYNFGEPEKVEDEEKGINLGTPYYVQAVYRSEADGDLALDIEERDTFGQYIKGKESQKLVLSGEGSLLVKMEFDGPTMYQQLYLEPANVAGKYNAYMEYDGMRQYLPAKELGTEEATYSKANAAPIELLNFESGEVLTKMPEGIFRPVKTALEIYENGVGTSKVFDLMNGSSDYVPGTESQMFEIYCYEDELFFIANPQYPIPYMLEPYEGEEGQYALSVTREGAKMYFVMTDGKPNMTENKEEAVHFGLKDAVYVNRSEGLKVTNVPKPDDVVPPSPVPSYTSVTVKKTWKLDDGRKAADSVEVALLKNGTEEKTVILNEENNWTYTWEGLPLGSAWTVKELDVPEGFDSTIQQVGTTYTIINDDQPTKPDDPAKPDDPTKPDDPAKPDKPTKPDKPSKPAKPNKPADPNHSMVPDDGLIPGGAGSHGAPQTGDTANAGLWLAGMGLSAAGLAALFFARRKKPGKNAD